MSQYANFSLRKKSYWMMLLITHLISKKLRRDLSQKEGIFFSRLYLSICLFLKFSRRQQRQTIFNKRTQKNYYLPAKCTKTEASFNQSTCVLTKLTFEAVLSHFLTASYTKP
jgi:hypothetical protein